MRLEPVHTRFPKVPLERRAAAFAIDFVGVWLVSALLGFNPVIQIVVFIVAWGALRVVVVSKNQGQSLGRWAMDMKVLDAKQKKLPELSVLAKREGILGGCALLAMIGLSIGLANAMSMLLLVAPLVGDCSIALTDEGVQQAFHDRVAQTVVIPTRRGYSLDLRLKKIFAQLRRYMQK